MIKKTIEISQQPAHLAVKLDQLLIQPHDTPREMHRSVPCEDLGVVLVDHPQTTYSHSALAHIVEHDAVLIVCGRDHLPAGILLPLSDHTQVVWRLHDQLNASKPTRKQLWKQIVQAKIRAQASNLAQNSPQRGRLLEMAREVRSNDAGNLEAQAAKTYWSAWLTLPSPVGRGAGGEGGGQDAHADHPNAIDAAAALTPTLYQREREKRLAFRRDPDDQSAPNNMLNYGYAVVRAAMARALVAGGLLPALGLHHHNRANAFCLADDLMEPLRPIVDRRVRELFMTFGRRELNQPTKAGLLEILTQEVRTAADQTGPLLVALHRMVASLVHCYQGEDDELVIPTVVEDDGSSSC